MSEVKECPKCQSPNIEQQGDIMKVSRKSDGVFECFIYGFKCLDCGQAFAAIYGDGGRDVINKLIARSKKEADG
jgi:hypothetical protein